MADNLQLHCLLCAEIKTSQLTQSILDPTNGIKEKLLACGLWMQSFDIENMPRIVCLSCANELIRCKRFFEQIASAERKLLQMCPIKGDSLMDDNNFGDITDYNTFDGDDFKSNDLTHFTEEVFCEPWVKTEPTPQEASLDDASSEDDKPVKFVAKKGRPTKVKPAETEKVKLTKVSLYKSSPRNSTPVKSSLPKTKETPKKVVERPVEKEKEPERPSEPEPEIEDEEDGSDLEDMTCRKCGIKFPNAVFLKVHKRVVCFKRIRDPQNLLHCDICKATYRTLNSMRNHMKKHAEGVIEYVCDRCGEKCDSSRQLITHMRKHTHPKITECHICGKVLKKWGNMKAHMQLHTNTKPHRCTLCDKSYHYRGGLEIHMATHTGVMPYNCEYCGKNFSQKGVLTLHIRSHTGERPYKCDFCDYAGIGAAMLRTHTLNEHGIDIKGRPRRRYIK